MTRFVFLLSALAVMAIVHFIPSGAAAQGGASGTIAGHVKLSGPPPGNPIIRMGLDPMCSKLNAGKRPIQESVVVSDDGGLANAFVDLKGTFPKAPAPTTPVTLEQRNCLYTPRVVGARVGGVLKIVDQDAVFHNVHSQSLTTPFNFSQQKAGMSRDVPLKGPEVMMRIGCDVHSWMVAWVGVETHPYFTVSAKDGAFTIKDVPPGRYTIRVWHERFGEVTKPVTVTAGKTTDIDFAYTGQEKPKTSRVEEVTLPLQAFAETDLRLIGAE